MENYSDTLKDDVATSANKVKERAQDMFEEGKKKGSATMANLEAQAYQVGEKMREYYQDASSYTKDGVNQLQEQVKAHPLLSVGISFLAGMLIAKLTGK
jgi:ElaB/YqjD/DUF883 family membrane-anchored ribosome-binding protein